jgi:hypothetical protein
MSSYASTHKAPFSVPVGTVVFTDRATGLSTAITSGQTVVLTTSTLPAGTYAANIDFNISCTDGGTVNSCSLGVGLGDTNQPGGTILWSIPAAVTAGITIANSTREVGVQESYSGIAPNFVLSFSSGTYVLESWAVEYIRIA